MKIQNFINGEFVSPQNEKYFDVFDPATGQVYLQSPDSDAIDIVRSVQAANKAFDDWSRRPASERAEFLNKIADVLESRKKEFAELESRDVGKPYWLAKEVDIPRTIQNFRYFAALVKSDSCVSKKWDHYALEYVRREPFGVTGLIAPWNLPLYTLTYKIAPSLAVGNTAVCKPSEWTPRTAFELAQVMKEVGLPEGVCNFVFGTGEGAGVPLVQHPGVPMISFTGGTATGSKIQAVAGPMMKRVGLELGGKNANIVFKDADLDLAVKGSLRASFLNSGQICLSGSRLLVQESIYEDFMERFRGGARDLRVGDPTAKGVFMGPLVSAEHFRKVQKAIAQARVENGKVTVGGGVPTGLGAEFSGGYFMEPTVIEDLTNCSELWQEEIFGPVVTVMSFKYPKDAVKWANTSSYGLSASLWTQDISMAHRIASELKVGTVWVNTWSMRDVALPFGGAKQSGVGRAGGEESLRAFSDLKTVCVALK